MKNVVIGFFMIVILVFSAAAIQTAGNKTTRKNELDTSLGQAMEQSMEILTVNPVYHIQKENGTEELIADFIQGFVTKTTSDSDFTIEILHVDAEKGILDVRAEEKFKQVIGYGTVSSRKTVILEAVEDESIGYCSVSFFTDMESETGNTYVKKRLNVCEGDKLNAAMLPQSGMERPGYIFCGWKMLKPESGIGILYGNENIGSLYIKGDMEFEAVYQKGTGS